LRRAVAASITSAGVGNWLTSNGSGSVPRRASSLMASIIDDAVIMIYSFVHTFIEHANMQTTRQIQYSSILSWLNWVLCAKLRV
jgi:hypothetical protein